MSQIAICDGCAVNVHLKRLIFEDGKPSLCSLCGLPKESVFELEQLRDVLALAIKQNFSQSRDDVVYGDPSGPLLSTIILEILQQEIPDLDELVSAIVETDRYEQHFRDDGFFDKSIPYMPVNHRVSIEHFDHKWKEIINELKHRRRFFSESVKKFFEGVFSGVEAERTWRTDGWFESVVSEEAPGMRLFRARVIEPEAVTEIRENPYFFVGPPPQQKARSMRMSAEGVVVFYCAMEEETAIAELRPAIGATVATIAIALSRPVRLLDFERLERLIDPNWSQLLRSDLVTARETRAFQRKLHKLISEPVLPGHENEYLITQTMAEYLAYVHAPSIDGIKFRSTQNFNGVNVVLFPQTSTDDGKSEFPVSYVEDSLEFHRLQRVKYTPEKLLVFSNVNGQAILRTTEQFMTQEHGWQDLDGL